MVGLFEQISEAHELYGAKHQDWQRYSKHCSSNARSIRKKHPSVVGCTSNGKFTGKTTPSFAKCPPSSISDVFQLFVWEAEKAWSEYMGCKEKVQKYGSSSSSSLSNRQLRHARRRLVVSSNMLRLLVILLPKLLNSKMICYWEIMEKKESYLLSNVKVFLIFIGLKHYLLMN